MTFGLSITTPGKIEELAAIFAKLKRILTEVLSHAAVVSELEWYDRSRPWLENPLPQVRQAKAARGNRRDSAGSGIHWEADARLVQNLRLVSLGDH